MSRLDGGPSEIPDDPRDKPEGPDAEYTGGGELFAVPGRPIGNGFGLEARITVECERFRRQLIEDRKAEERANGTPKGTE